ncbi:predicted protein, partial [Thalassiosira pseudonana CCMP1335]
FQNVCYYLDRIVSDIVQPKQLVFLAIDGVAPRAKLNQQRSRRYRSGSEKEIEMHLMTLQPISINSDESAELSQDENHGFHSNCITPGTPFLYKCSQRILEFIRHKLQTDPKWHDLTIIFSGHDVPGEGEHKIMDFMRHEKNKPGYDPNLRHCIYGQDGDLVMLGLATHEPHLCLLREEVVFD